MNTTSYFLQTPAGYWEGVDEFIFVNWKFARLDDDQPRYNGNRVTKGEDGKVSVELVGTVTPKELALIARMTGAGPDLSPNMTIPGGIVRDPEFVILRKGNQTILKKVGGDKFIAKKAA